MRTLKTPDFLLNALKTAGLAAVLAVAGITRAASGDCFNTATWNLSTRGLKDVPELSDGKSRVLKDRLERLALKNGARVDRNDRPAAIGFSPEDGVAATRLASEAKSDGIEGPNDIPGSDRGETLAHLGGNRDGGDRHLPRTGNGLATGFQVGQIGVEGAAHFSQGFLESLSLDVTSGKGGAVGEIPALLATLDKNRVLEGRFPHILKGSRKSTHEQDRTVREIRLAASSFRAIVNVQHAAVESNQRYQQLYRYNYSATNYLFGVSHEY